MPSQPLKVLLVDDEFAMRRALRTSLTACGYVVEEAGTGEEAIENIRRQPFDLVLLDSNMPGMSGLEACRQIRPLAPRAGIVMITVRDGVDDKVDALEAGADDYITKPFPVRELMARLRAVVRRSGVPLGERGATLRAGELELDLEHRLLRKGGERIHLSPTEFNLLAFLMQRPDTAVEHSKLLRAVWGPEYGSELEYLRSYIKMLRKKIETDPANPEYILTEPWMGYRFRSPAYAAPAEPK